MRMFHVFEQLSVRRLILLSGITTILLTGLFLWLGVGADQKGGKLSQKFQKPQQITEKEILPEGPVPSEPPKIGRVFPWVGKVGDVVWIQGEHFGDNPTPKQLTIGGVVVSEEHIVSWRTDQIQAIIPTGAAQGGVVIVSVGDHPIATSLPYVLYDRSATIQLKKQDAVISIQNNTEVVKARYWTGDERIPTQMAEVDVDPTVADSTLFDSGDLPLLSIVLMKDNGDVVPYYVNPDNFGF